MFKTLINVFRIPELRNKMLFTLFMLMIYRIGYHIPIPGVDQANFAALQAKQQQGAQELQTREAQIQRNRDYVSQQIAQKLCLSVKTVEAQMGKALRMLRKRLAPWLPPGKSF